MKNTEEYDTEAMIYSNAFLASIHFPPPTQTKTIMYLKQLHFITLTYHADYVITTIVPITYNWIYMRILYLILNGWVLLVPGYLLAPNYAWKQEQAEVN